MGLILYLFTFIFSPMCYGVHLSPSHQIFDLSAHLVKFYSKQEMFREKNPAQDQHSTSAIGLNGLSLLSSQNIVSVSLTHSRFYFGVFFFLHLPLVNL